MKVKKKTKTKVKIKISGTPQAVKAAVRNLAAGMDSRSWAEQQYR